MHIHLAKSKGECWRAILHTALVLPTRERTKSPGYDTVSHQKYSCFRHHSKQAGPWIKPLVIVKGPDSSLRAQHLFSVWDTHWDFAPLFLLAGISYRAADCYGWAMYVCAGEEGRGKKKILFPAVFLLHFFFQHTGATILEIMAFCRSTWWMFTANKTLKYLWAYWSG